MYYTRLCVRHFFKGYAAGPHWNRHGSGSNFLCLPEHPQWKTFVSGVHKSAVGEIYGVQYGVSSAIFNNNVFSKKNNNGQTLLKRPAPCAMCYVAGRSVVMVPARTQCPRGWIKQYGGYLVSEAKGNEDRGRSNYVCWDEAPEGGVGGRVWHSVIYPVEVRCGPLPCSEYIDSRQLACVVCSK